MCKSLCISLQANLTVLCSPEAHIPQRVDMKFPE